jgi:hypothetical protein
MASSFWVVQQSEVMRSVSRPRIAHTSVPRKMLPKLTSKSHNVWPMLLDREEDLDLLTCNEIRAETLSFSHRGASCCSLMQGFAGRRGVVGME